MRNGYKKLYVKIEEAMSNGYGNLFFSVWSTNLTLIIEKCEHYKNTIF